MNTTHSPAAPETPPLASRQPKPALRWVAVVLALAGWVVSLQLLLASAGAAAPLLDAICVAGGESPDDCGAVLRSQWAYIGKPDNLARLPVAALGMAYFAFVGLWYLLIGTPSRARAGWHVLLLLVVALGVWFSFDLVRVMLSELRRTCSGCLLAHAINLGLALLSIVAWPWGRRAAVAAPHPSWRLGAAATIACTAVGLGHLLFAGALNAVGSLQRISREYSRIVDDPAYVRWNYERQPAVEIPSRDNDAALGSPEAANTVVVFSDFQCAACRQAHDILDRLARDFPDRLRVELRHFPQDPECNPNPRFRVGGHPVACKAARAAEAALAVGGPAAAHELHRRMFEAQRDLERRSFAELAAASGVRSAAEFDAAWYAPSVADRVRADIELGAKLGVESVPAVFLNGRRLENWRRRETWEALAGIPPLATRPAD